MTIGDRIRTKREEAGFTQEDLAYMLGLKDKSSVSKIEKSGNNVSVRNVKKYANALGVSSDYILTGKEDPVFIINSNNADQMDVMRNFIEYIKHEDFRPFMDSFMEYLKTHPEEYEKIMKSSD